MSRNTSEFRLGWKVILAGMLGIGIGVSGAPFYTLGVFLKPLSGEFGWSRAETSAATLFLTFGSALTAPIVGRLADRLNIRKIALFSLCGVALAYLGLTQTTANVASWYFGLGCLAIAGCGTTNLIWSHAVTSWFDRSRGLALGLTLTGSGICGIVAPRAIDTLIHRYGWQAGYTGLSLFALFVALPVVFVFFHEKPKPRGQKGKDTAHLPGLTVAQAMRTWRYWQLAFGIMLVAGSIAAMIVHLVPLLTDSGVSRGAATSIAGLMGFAVVFGRVAIGFLVDRLHAPYVAAVLLTLPGIGYLLIATGAVSGSTVLVAAILFGLSAGAEADLLAYLGSRFFGLRAFGAIYGLLLLPFGTGAGIAPIIMGRVYDVTGHYTPALYGGALCCVTGALLIGTLGRYPKFSTRTDAAPMEMEGAALASRV
jgi:MFS family permease